MTSIRLNSNINEIYYKTDEMRPRTCASAPQQRKDDEGSCEIILSIQTVLLDRKKRAVGSPIARFFI